MSPPAHNQRILDGGITVNVCDRIHEACACDVLSTNGMFPSNTWNLNENELPKNCRFAKNSVLNLQTAHEPSLRLGFLSRTLSYMERQLGGPLTKSLMTKWSMSGVSLLLKSNSEPA